MAWKGIVGKSFTASGFDAYVHSLTWVSWHPSLIVLHNMASPSLAQRPQGLTRQHIANLEGYYRDQQHWSAGPHLFIDDKQIWVFTPLTTPGVHSPSWNSISLGIEMLGDYDKESFTTGRGLAVQTNAVSAIASLCSALGLDPTALRLHKEDKKTTHACPGKNVVKAAVIKAVTNKLVGDVAPVGIADLPFANEPPDDDDANNRDTVTVEEPAKADKTVVGLRTGAIGTGLTTVAAGAAKEAFSNGDDVVEKITTVADKSGQIVAVAKQAVAVPKPGFWEWLFHFFSNPWTLRLIIILILVLWGGTWAWQRFNKKVVS